MTGRREYPRLLLSRRTILGAAAAAALGANKSFASFAEPVQFVVGLGAGSGPDVVCRLLADQLSPVLNKPVTVVNQPGATGGIAMRTVGTAPADGRTLLFALSSTFVALPEIQASYPYDLSRDFVPVGFVGEVPMVLAASSALGVSTITELVDLAKRQRRPITVAVSNRGGTPHLTAEKLRLDTGMEMITVPYPGPPQALNDILGGRVDATVDSLPALKGSIRGGSLKPLAVGSSGRLANFPEIPAASETLPGFRAVGWFAVMAPPRTPEAIAADLSHALQSVLGQPALQTKLREIGFYAYSMSPAELRSFIKADQDMWRPVIAQVGMSAK